ncbi:MAG: hypothetical protein ACE5JH_08290 [Acidobacteriota bacterium]
MVTESSRQFPGGRAAACLALAVLTAAGLSGCAVFRRLDVDQIHQASADRPERNPVIFLHGFIGSKLKNRHTQESIWGRFMNAIKRGQTEDLRLPIDALPINENRDDLVAYSLYEKVAGVKFYAALLESLVDAGGYRLGDIENPQPGDTLFIYYYDWRRDNVESAMGLGRAIRQIKERLKAPEMRFDIVAHSMGGLVAAYYLKYGAEDVLDGRGDHPVTYAGAPHIGRMILIGTPLRGTMSAFRVLNTGFSRTMSPDVVFTMPSIYQLLPHEGRGHFVDDKGNPIDVDLYDARSWVKYGWSVFNPRYRTDSRRARAADARSVSNAALSGRARAEVFLQAVLDRARAFHAALRRDGEAGSPVPIHIFGSDCIPTLDRAILKTTGSGSITLFNDERTPDRDVKQLQTAMLAPGDGTVTAQSLLALDGPPSEQGRLGIHSRDFASCYFFCESHGLLSTNRAFQDNMFYVLFYSPVRPAPGARFAGGK